MDDVDMAQPSRPGTSRASSAWLLLFCSVAAIAVALVPCAGLLAQRSPNWLVVGAGAAIFPFLPLLWHVFAEAKRSDRGAAPSASRTRFALRSLALALLVLGVSLGDLGPRRVGQSFGELIGRIRGKSEPTPAPKPTPAPALSPSRVVLSQPIARDGLEAFIPADASLAVGLAGSEAMGQLLAAFGIDTREKVTALATCKIDLGSARVLIAARGSGTHMIVVRAPGITDERNLYCLVGVMGSDRMQISPQAAGASKSYLVKGFLSRPLSFQVLDSTTVIATDEGWRATADKKLFSAGADTAEGRLAPPLDRIDRGATLWSVSVDDTPQGPWDLALDARLEGNTFKLQGSSIPPSGAGDRAEIAVRVPLAFASALPGGALAQGIRGLVAAVVATGASLSAPPKVLPTLPKSAGVPDGGHAAIPGGAAAK
jgi:hypothetical protein